MDPNNFWVWFATEAFFGVFVAAVLWYFFRQIEQQHKQHKKKDDQKGKPGH